MFFEPSIEFRLLLCRQDKLRVTLGVGKALP
jgi:hypothetical protein